MLRGLSAPRGEGDGDTMRRRVHFSSWAAIAGVMLLMLAAAPPAAAQAELAREPQGVLWGRELFRDADDLRDWLERRGRSYEVWALRHPHAAAQLDPLDERPAQEAESSLPMVGWIAIFAALAPAALALGLALWPPTLGVARRRIALGAFGVGVIAAGATALAVAS